MRPLHTPFFSIVPEGWVVLALLAAIGGSAWLQGATGLSLCLLLLTLLSAYFFIDAARDVPNRPRGVLAPVDGTVVHRDECHDPQLGRAAVRVTLAVSFWGGYCLRAPIEGEVQALPASQQRNVSRLQSDEGDEVVLVMSRGWMLGARPLSVAIGSRVGQGRRCGVRRLARCIDIYLPAGVRVEVELGQRVRCGETVLATILRRPQKQ